MIFTGYLHELCNINRFTRLPLVRPTLQVSPSETSRFAVEKVNIRVPTEYVHLDEIYDIWVKCTENKHWDRCWGVILGQTLGYR